MIPLIEAIPPVRGRRGRPRRRPANLYADRGYDHDNYRAQVRAKGITPVIARCGDEGQLTPLDALGIAANAPAERIGRRLSSVFRIRALHGTVLRRTNMLASRGLLFVTRNRGKKWTESISTGSNDIAYFYAIPLGLAKRQLELVEDQAHDVAGLLIGVEGHLTGRQLDVPAGDLGEQLAAFGLVEPASI